MMLKSLLVLLAWDAFSCIESAPMLSSSQQATLSALSRSSSPSLLLSGMRASRSASRSASPSLPENVRTLSEAVRSMLVEDDHHEPSHSASISPIRQHHRQRTPSHPFAPSPIRLQAAPVYMQPAIVESMSSQSKKVDDEEKQPETKAKEEDIPFKLKVDLSDHVLTSYASDEGAISSPIERQFKEAILRHNAQLVEALMECPICLDRIGSQTMGITECGHVMHQKCFAMIPACESNHFLDVSEKRKCPLCRTPTELITDKELQKSLVHRVVAVFEEKGWIPKDIPEMALQRQEFSNSFLGWIGGLLYHAFGSCIIAPRENSDQIDINPALYDDYYGFIHAYHQGPRNDD